jgi:hypothetical protein
MKIEDLIYKYRHSTGDEYEKSKLMLADCAANHFPALLEALKEIDSAIEGSENDDFECANDEAVKKIRAALAAASEVIEL